MEVMEGKFSELSGWLDKLKIRWESQRQNTDEEQRGGSLDIPISRHDRQIFVHKTI